MSSPRNFANVVDMLLLKIVFAVVRSAVVLWKFPS